MSGFHSELTQARRALIDEQLAIGINQPSVMAKILLGSAPFKYHTVATLTTVIAHHLRNRNIQFTSMVKGNLPKAVRNKRKTVLDSFFEQYPEMKEQSIQAMAKAIFALKLPTFERCVSVEAVWCALKVYIKHKLWSKSDLTATKKLPTSPRPVALPPPEPVMTFDELVAKVSLTLPLGAHREIDKLLQVLRPAYDKLRTRKPTVVQDSEQIASLEQHIAELEKELATLKAHHCPDVDAELRSKNEMLNKKNTALDAENQEFRGQIRNLKLRVETLSRATAPSLVARRGFAG